MLSQPPDPPIDDDGEVPRPPLELEIPGGSTTRYFSSAGRPWAPLVLRNSEGVAKPILYNAIVVLENDPVFREQQSGRSVLRYDKFRGRARAWGPLPWEKNGQFPRDWTDQDDRECNSWLQDQGLFLGHIITGFAVQTVMERNGYHPVMDYLNDLLHDGIPRIDEWLSIYCGVENNEYSRAVGMRWLVSACARISEPGCKVDTALILEGPQGRKKSMVLDVMGGPYYTSDIAVIGSTASQEQIIGKWIVELDELDAVSRATDVAAVKAFISRRVDDFRLPYGHRSRAHPRQCVFAGTTNRDSWNRDDTGGRRYWPVRVGEEIDIDGLQRDRDQIWAEARDRFMMGQPWWLDEQNLVELARIEQDARYEVDPWEDQVIATVKTMTIWPDRGVGYTDILRELGIPIERQTRSEGVRLGIIMRRLGWRRDYLDLDRTGTRTWRFFRP